MCFAIFDVTESRILSVFVPCHVLHPVIVPFASAAQVVLPAGSVIRLPCGTANPPGPGAQSEHFGLHPFMSFICITAVRAIKTRSNRPAPEKRDWEHFYHTLIIGRDISTVRFLSYTKTSPCLWWHCCILPLFWEEHKGA